MPPVGHVGHWATSLLYLVPVAAVVAWLGIARWRQRRRGAREAARPRG